MQRVLLSLCLLLGLALAPSGARGDAFEDAVLALNAGSYDAKVQAVDELAALRDERAIPILAAMEDGRLFVRESDGLLVIGEKQGREYRLIGALDGEDHGVAPSRELEKVRVNNRVRGGIEAALGRLQLQNPDPQRRIAAVDAMLRDRSPEAAAMLRAAFEAETEPQVRGAMAFGVAAMDLAGDDPDRRLAAIDLLAGSFDPRARALLGEVAADPAAAPEVKAAAERAIAAVERKRQMLDLVANLYQGISLGSILLLAAIGLAITFGVMGVINMAHGEMIMLGAYSAFVVQELFRAFGPPAWFDLYLVAAVPAAFLVAGAVGIGIERGVIRFLYGRPLETLLATWGVSLILQQAVRMIFGAPNRAVANPSWMSGGFEVFGGVFLTWNRLIIIVFCLAVLGAVALILRFTRFGLEMRAVTQSRSTAATMGINTARVDALTFGLGSGVASMGGVALSQIGNVSPNLGQLYIVDSFMVVVFGGVGNLAGTFVGAMTLGVINKFLEPVAGAVLGKVVVLALIILFIQRRPRGLFALKGRAVEA
ncbi:MAG TPA: urea ABC transporter permease subunit UrtB [Geminicoccaceae bacterium]|nr:urea ABC transporter permease subunit UrtB [Geminicoccaceae bacterium]